MAAHPFLSDEWLAEARRIHDEYRGRTTPVAHAVRMNLVISAVPFGTGAVDAHIDTVAGELAMDIGSLPDADVTLTLDYDTAKRILVDQEPEAALAVVLGGHATGDLAKLILLYGHLTTPDPVAAEAAGKIRAVTR